MLTTNQPFLSISSGLAIIALFNFAFLSLIPNIFMFIVEGNSNFSSGVPIRATFVSLVLSIPYLVNNYYLPTKAFLCKLLFKS